MTSAINVPVGVSADGAVAAAIDAKPIIPIEQAVQELEQVILPTQSVSTMALHREAPSWTPKRSKKSRVHNNGSIYTRTTHTHTNNSSNNNNINNNHPPHVVHNVGGYNGQLNQQQSPPIRPYNNSIQPNNMQSYGEAGAGG